MFLLGEVKCINIIIVIIYCCYIHNLLGFAHFSVFLCKEKPSRRKNYCHLKCITYLSKFWCPGDVYVICHSWRESTWRSYINRLTGSLTFWIRVAILRRETLKLKEKQIINYRTLHTKISLSASVRNIKTTYRRNNSKNIKATHW